MLCQICQLKTVSLRGVSTCSLECATIACGEDPEPVKTRLGAEVYRVNMVCIAERERLIAEIKKPNVRVLKSKI